MLSVLPTGGESLSKVREDFGKFMERISYEFGPFQVDMCERVVQRGGKLLSLTPKVFNILQVLIQNPGMILTVLLMYYYTPWNLTLISPRVAAHLESSMPLKGCQKRRWRNLRDSVRLQAAIPLWMRTSRL
jgi:hypothetical protein